MRFFITCFLMFCSVGLFCQNPKSYPPIDSIENVFNEKDSFTLRYNVRSFFKKNTTVADDSTEVFYIKSGGNYYARERDNTIITENGNQLMISENTAVIFYQKAQSVSLLEKSLFLNDILKKNASVSEVYDSNRSQVLYKWTTFDTQYKYFNLYLTKDGLIPVKMETELYPRFAELDGVTQIIFPKTIIDITYYDYADTSIMHPKKISDVIEVNENKVSLTSQYFTYELYEL